MSKRRRKVARTPVTMSEIVEVTSNSLSVDDIDQALITGNPLQVNGAYHIITGLHGPHWSNDRISNFADARPNETINIWIVDEREMLRLGLY
jgi:hypothetical protein